MNERSQRANDTAEPTPGNTHRSALPAVRHRIRREDLVRYAAASGDLNPIHWSDRAATDAGLTGVVAHGMFVMGLAVQAVADALPHGTVLSCSAKFAAPVYVADDDAGTELTIEATVSGDPQPSCVPVALVVVCGAETVLTGAVLVDVTQEPR
jgi:acyl dehydratase